MTGTVAPPDEHRAWGWVAHLRSGGTTPWSAWTGPAQRAGRFLPGAQQLELLRRLNESAGPSPVPAELADRVLHASAPGRGRPDLELVGAESGSAFGPRPVDPAELPVDELVRVSSSLLADDVVATGLPVREGRPLARPWRRHYRLVGDPALADPLRAQLIARGRPPGGARARIIVLGAPADRMLADTFTARALDRGGPSWVEWVASLAERDQLAPRVDLARTARVWAERTSPDQVTLVLDPQRVGRLVGVRSGLVAPPPLPAAAVDLARRVAAVLALLVTPPTRAALLRETLAPLLAGAPGPVLGVPEEHRAWLTGRAERMREQLRRAGYPVVGGASGGDSLDGVLPVYPSGGVVDVDNDEVLGLALAVLLCSVRSGPIRSDLVRSGVIS